MFRLRSWLLEALDGPAAVDRPRAGVIDGEFDAPAVGGAILLRPTQSFALFRQQVGRCLRPKPDGLAAMKEVPSASDTVSAPETMEKVTAWPAFARYRQL
jgi:hypothetical protein